MIPGKGKVKQVPTPKSSGNTRPFGLGWIRGNSSNTKLIKKLPRPEKRPAYPE